MKFQLDPLPYQIDSLEPHISAKTLDIHFNKHHKGYMTKLEKAIADTPRARKSLEDIVMHADGDEFNNAAQVWNHSFYWNCMDPKGGGSPAKSLEERINADIGGVDAFKREFANIAAGQFGSGWAWLVCSDSGKLEVVSTSDAFNPLRAGIEPILTLDVWEHAYYLDYQNDRAAYIEAFLDHLINWQFAEANYEVAAKRIGAGNTGEQKTLKLA